MTDTDGQSRWDWLAALVIVAVVVYVGHWLDVRYNILDLR